MISSDEWINTIPSSLQRTGKDGFSDNNPYPGWIASAFVFFAISIIFQGLNSFLGHAAHPLSKLHLPFYM